MQTIFVVIGGFDYEGSSPLRAFPDRHEAEEFAAACREYEKSKPPLGYKDPQEWLKEDRAWSAAHPGGEDAPGCDYFSVREIPFGADPSQSQEGAQS